MPLNTFTPTGAAMVCATPSSGSTAVALPGSGGDTTLLVTNLGEAQVVLLIGDGSVSVSAASGIALGPNQQLALARGVNDHIAVQTINAGIQMANVNVASGT